MAASEFKIVDEKHESRKEQWKSGFQVPRGGRERVLGYKPEMDALLTSLRGMLSAQRARVPFEIARSVQAGVFLWGPPGCGKTHLASAAAGTLKVPLIVIQPAHILGEHAGQSGHALSGLFAAGMEIAAEKGGAVVFFDELEAYGRRTPDMQGLEITLSNLLKFIDRATSAPEGHRLAIIAATNNPRSCEPALLSRLSTHIEIGLPEGESRRAYLARAVAAATEAGFIVQAVDIEALVQASEGLTIRQIAQALDALNATFLDDPTNKSPRITGRMLSEVLAGGSGRTSLTSAYDPAYA